MAVNSPIVSAVSQGINSSICGGGAAAAYSTTASDYDGTNDYASRGADLTGNSDSDKGVISFCFRLDGGNGLTLYPRSDADGGSGNRIYRQGSDSKLKFITQAGFSLASTSTYNAAATWHSVLIAWDISDPVAGNNWAYMYIDDVQEASDTSITQGTYDSTRTDHIIGAWNTGGNKWNGCLSEWFEHYGATVDPTVEANRRLFFDGNNKPVDKGADGSTPLGVQPLVYSPDADPSDNKGSGGNFTITGALTACSSSPTD